MGVPAFFRWLSKKYPKIIVPVVEERAAEVENDSGGRTTVPLDITVANPNGMEFDNLYLDMNNIVHPCTHPEGKAAPESEEEMMLEVFKYTERLVNMVRPRKVLFMAIDGVAPRAKMNQQRSRRFRSAQEAKEKEVARAESILLWESMGKTLSEEEKNKPPPWDSNAITPGTPFMDLLAASLRYWVTQKVNTDPGWKHIQVFISDASVPGEGEHKIIDFIRRQRCYLDHDPNTKHVVYGLDADLIMLALATHEPYFRVLREDVFFQDTKPNACRICGQEGHYAAQCTGEAKEVKKTAPEDKPYIFLDVPALREYLEIELNVPQTPFPFDLERAIDDWIFLIFFVGNDFLPHMPSLEIREGAIDVLLKIWKDELPRIGGYVTDCGTVVLHRASVILDGLAIREDEIFRRRKDMDDRQEQNAKRRKLEQTAKANGTAMVAVTTTTTHTNVAPNPLHPSLPPKPVFAATTSSGPQDSFSARADSLGFGAPALPSKPLSTSTVPVPLPVASPSPVPDPAPILTPPPAAVKALAGSNRDVVANRHAIRMANLSAAESLKAEIAGLIPVKRSKNASPKKTSLPTPPPSVPILVPPIAESAGVTYMQDDEAVPGLGNHANLSVAPPPVESVETENVGASSNDNAEDQTMSEVNDNLQSETDEASGDANDNPAEDSPRGVKRKIEEVQPDEEQEDDEEEAPPAEVTYELKVKPDGSVEQEDTVKFWEPGYKERYYRQKFGVELSDLEFRQQITTCYIEGLCWVLQYYYHGTPSWQWFYPYHFAPFAADFQNIGSLELNFQVGQPFKPFEQLMGVFPAASKSHIPQPFHHLMTDEDSPIIDFYPTTFQIDMNGKKMAWQGVALLPFIDEQRLLDAMAPDYDKLTEEEVKRNTWGDTSLIISDEHSLYPSLEQLYTKRKTNDPLPIDGKVGDGVNGGLLADPACLPGSTYYSPLSKVNLVDIEDNRSLSALYFFPKQLKPHRSVLLPGVRKPARVLTQDDVETVRRGGRPRGRGGPPGGGHNSYRGDNRRDLPSMYGGSSAPRHYSSGGSRGRDDYSRGPPPPPRHEHPRGYGGYSGSGGGGYAGRGGPSGNYESRPPPSNYGSGPGKRESAGGYGGYDGQTNNYGGYGGRGGGGGRQQGYEGGNGGGYGGYGGSNDGGAYGGGGRGGGGNYGGYGGGYGDSNGYGGGGGRGVGGSYNSGGYGNSSSTTGGHGYGGYGGYSGQNAAPSQASSHSQGGYGGYGGYGSAPPPSQGQGGGRGGTPQPSDGYYSTMNYPTSNRGRGRGGRY